MAQQALEVTPRVLNQSVSCTHRFDSPVYINETRKSGGKGKKRNFCGFAIALIVVCLCARRLAAGNRRSAESKGHRECAVEKLRVDPDKVSVPKRS